MAVGPWQIVIIALIVLLLFGASRLSDIGKGLGEGIRNFKKGISEDSDEDKDESGKNDEPKQLSEKGSGETGETKRKQSEKSKSKGA